LPHDFFGDGLEIDVRGIGHWLFVGIKNRFTTESPFGFAQGGLRHQKIFRIIKYSCYRFCVPCVSVTLW
jgi:hypothetical protein